MGRKDGEASTGGFVLLGGSQGPEGDRATAKLREPALELRLSSVVGQAGHVKDLASFRQESPNVGTSIHGPGEDIGMLLGWLRLADEAAKDPSQGDGLLHGPTWGSGRQSL